ncbi:MAG TPA: hypothetical protein PLL66_05240 [Bacteroidales bacterium]|nr:hypothetical protein [Bacteroidales bacterium]
MKKTLITLCFSIISIFCFSQEYKVVTIVESIVPMGLGRSRIIENKTEQDVAALSTERTDGKTSDQGKVSRDDVKVEEFEETKLLNFYSAVGINFQNIASNDAVITAKINELAQEGWKLTFVTSAVESDAGEKDGAGIFVTRLFFTR